MAIDCDVGSLLGGIFTALITGAGLFYAAQQIKIARIEQVNSEKWRRNQFARGLLEKLSTDDELGFCTRALDWGVGPLVIPLKHRPLFKDGKITFEHDWKTLERSVGLTLASDWDKPEYLTYRYCFDTFFSFLESVVLYVELQNIDGDQMIGLEYYISMIKRPIYMDKYNPISRNDVFRPFIEKFYPHLTKKIWPPEDKSPNPSHLMK